MNKQFQEGVLRAVGRYIRKQMEPVYSAVKSLRESVDEFEGRVQVLGEARALPGPRGEPGEKGEPGKDAEPVLVADVVAEILALPQFKALVDLQVAESIAEYFKEHPARDGRDGKDGDRGEPGPQGIQGEKGADGIGLADALIDREGSLVLTMTDGRSKALGVIVGRDGKDGAAGRDGLSMVDVAREYDAETHEVVERWAVAGVAHELRYPAGGIRPGGFWREGMKSFALQAVTHDGALWIAKRDTAAKPCLENADDWQLAARKGRDGRDGKDGKAAPGPVKLVAGDA